MLHRMSININLSIINMEKLEMNRLKEVIKSKGLKNTYICSKMELHPSILSGYIKGTRKPNQERLKQLSRILNTSVEKLYPNCTKKRITYYEI